MARINKRQWKPMGTNRTTEAMQAICEKNANESRLLSLPPEIRNRIYRLVLGDRTIHVWSITPERRCRHTVCHGETCNSLMLNGMASSSFYPTEKGELVADKCVSQQKTGLSIQFLRTCRQIYKDAALIPYATNDFRVHSTAFARFEKQMSSFQKKSIMTLTVLYAGPDWRAPFENKAVQKFSGLEKLNVVVYHERWDSWRMNFIEKFSGLPLQDVSIVEFQERFGSMHSFDHQALRKRLIDAGEKRRAQEPIRQAKMKERTAMTKEYRKAASKAYEEEVRQAMQSGNARSVRAERRQKVRAGDD